MNEIVILSGKGGTGKTTVAAALAMVAKQEIVVADCDVDAANMHLLLKPDFAEDEEFFSTKLAFVDHDVCSLCEKCLDVCRFDAVHIVEQKCLIDPINCEGCGYCEKVCPEHAISMRIPKAGHVYISEIKSGATMVHARLDAGGENSGKLVAKVKNDAKKLAKIQNKLFVLVDGSPGIGCPVVSSLSGASLVLLVTEPSISAMHDLERLHQLLRNFNIPAVCLINKSDIDETSVSDIKAFLLENNIPLVAEIPYNSLFTQAMVQGMTVSEYDEGFKNLMNKIWEKLKKLLIN